MKPHRLKPGLPVLFCVVFACLSGRRLAEPGVTRAQDHDLPGEAVGGILPEAPGISAARAAGECLQLPVLPPGDRLLGPHGASVISTRCEVMSYRILEGIEPATWSTARYLWTSVFTAEDARRGLGARDTITEEEVVLFQAGKRQELRPVWHARFEAGESGQYGIWRSITPQVARTGEGTILLSVLYCVNGTGGCNMEFLQRHDAARWSEVRQAWLDELPSGFRGRIRHGYEIDPRTLKGEAGFYRDSDANCCPSEVLKFDLGLRGDSLILIGQRALPNP